MKKVIRTISGITPLAVMLKPYPCPHGKCIYCPSQTNVPESYTKTSPVVLRAVDCDWDPFRQVKARLKIFSLMGHITDKIELIIMGGTFSGYPEDYQEEFIKGCFDGLNNYVSKNLEEAKKMNEIAKNRCVAMCIETRPDYCKENHINNFLKFGSTRIEIGVQALDNEIYKRINRGHNLDDVINSTKLLKNSCYKVGYHMMLGLPGSNPEKDLETFKTIFSDERFQPDNIKIYPTFVVKGTELENLYTNRNYKTYNTEEIINLLIEIKKIVPPYVRIMRVMRDIPAEHIVSDCVYSHLRSSVKSKMKELGLTCNCIRCREVGHVIHDGKEVIEKVKLKRINYDASDGKEIFLSFESGNILIGLLRLRIPDKSFRPEINNKTALVREIHVYGPQVPIDSEPKTEWQHRGYGKKLLEEAERIAREEFDCNKMIIISGVGVREYFYKFGYKSDGPYVSKLL